jgi:hypothetical protein
MVISRSILLRMRNVSEKSCRENQDTYYMFNNFFSKIVPFMNYVEKYGTARQATDDNIIRRMRFACWIPKITDTLRICNTLLFHGNNCHANAPQCYVIRALPVLLVLYSMKRCVSSAVMLADSRSVQRMFVLRQCQ